MRGTAFSIERTNDDSLDTRAYTLREQMSCLLTSGRLMKRAFALGVLLAIVAPVAAVVVMACSAASCCAAETDRVTRSMPCCQPAMCANPAPDTQAPTTAPSSPAQTSIDAAASATEVADVTPIVSVRRIDARPSPPRATSVRLALIATLLI